MSILGMASSRSLILIMITTLASCQCHVRQTGRVMDADSGNPVADAVVEMEDVRALTDSRGYFLIEYDSRDCGNREITVRKPGYRPFLLEVDDEKKHTSYQVEDRTKYEVFDEPRYLGNDSADYRLGRWNMLNSTGFTAFGPDSLVFYLVPVD